MDEIPNASGDEHLLAVGDTFDQSERFLKAFSHTSSIGFAILDRELRYQAINRRLAEVNGIPARVHLGVRIRDIFGEIAEKIAEPGYRRVLHRAQSSHFEV